MTKYNFNAHYIEAKEFNDFCQNQNKLIDILNHRMTKMEVDVSWIKKFVTIQVSILTAIFLAVFGIAIKVLGA